MLDFGEFRGRADLVAQSDFKDVFEHDASEEFYDVSHLWPRMDSLSDSETDRRRTPRDIKLLNERDDLFDCRTMGSTVSSKRSQLIHSNRANSYLSYDCEHPLVNARQFGASKTFSEHQIVQDDFDDLQ